MADCGVGRLPPPLARVLPELVPSQWLPNTERFVLRHLSPQASQIGVSILEHTFL